MITDGRFLPLLRGIAFSSAFRHNRIPRTANVISETTPDARNASRKETGETFLPAMPMKRKTKVRIARFTRQVPILREMQALRNESVLRLVVQAAFVGGCTGGVIGVFRWLYDHGNAWIVSTLRHGADDLATALIVFGTLILLGLAWASEQSGREPLAQASSSVTRSLEMAETGQRNAEAITAMVRELALQSQLIARDTDQWLLRLERLRYAPQPDTEWSHLRREFNTLPWPPSSKH